MRDATVALLYSKVAHLYALLALSETVVLKRAKFAAYIHLGELILYTFH
jgi:hypothetical protein